MPKKIKPVLQVDKQMFLSFMMDDEDGVNMSQIKRALKKKGSFTLEDLVKVCGIIPSEMIKNPKVVTKEMMAYDNGEDGFEIAPEDFTIKLI